jgi:tetratricopeptide (TPR) repeat protein
MVKPLVIGIFAVLALLVCMPLRAATSLTQEQQPWRMMEKAHLAYSEGDYGLAVRLAEEAKQNKAKEYAWFISTISNELKIQQVQRAGDGISAVMEQLQQRNAYTAIEILSSFVDSYGEEFFQNKVSMVLEYITKMSVLPEADCVIGDAYLLQGEVELAKEYYRQAFDKAYGLDIPDSKYDILYKLADLAIMQADDALLEQSLLLVLADDPYYNGEARFSENQGPSSPYLRAMIRSIANGYSIDRIFLMYRANTYRSLQAFIMLASFYKRINDTERFLGTSALGALTAFTRMYEIVSERDLEFSYTTVDAFFNNSMRYFDVREWMTKNAVWNSFVLFADALSVHGQRSLASEILQILVKYAPENIAAMAKRAQ